MHLSHGEVGFRYYMQNFMAIYGGAARSSLSMLPPLILLSIIIRNNVLNPTTLNTAATATSFLLRIQCTNYIFNQNRFSRLIQQDHIYHDIPLEEENNALATRLPRQNIRFNSWTDQECYDNTSFRKEQLQRIYHKFGLAQLAAQNHGFIRVPTNHETYRFDPEELFLFLMTKCKTGLSNKVLCDLIFGGHASRWSFGYPWILRYLDERYKDTIGNQVLHRFVDDFPKFYNAFNSFVQKTSTQHHNDGTATDHLGLRFMPFDIFALIDCSIYRINRPLSGPDGDYIGAPRRENYFNAQRSVYTGYKKCHGIKVQTIMLPNGISCVYGPASARVSDIGANGILEMSGLDMFLLQLQQNAPHTYIAFGDGAYNANGLQCKFFICRIISFLTLWAMYISHILTII